jgi:hypothetical protein
MERIARSFRLTRQAYQILMHDKELMILPLISGVICIGVALTFVFAFRITDGNFREDPKSFLPMFLFYVVSYAIGIFFQAAVIAGATERLRGGNPSVGSALAAASRRLGAIVSWAVVAATVGMIFRAIQDRAGFLGKIAVGLIGAAWSLATFFVVPVLVLEDISLTESVKRSWAVFKKTWGETFVGSAGIGIAAFLAWITLVAVVGLIAYLGGGIVALIVGGVGVVLLLIFFAALQGVYVASLYRYATEGREAAGFDHELLAEAFVPKRS